MRQIIWVMGLDGSTKTLKNYMDITNVHSNLWHTESIVINDTKQFCFDDVEFVM